MGFIICGILLFYGMNYYFQPVWKDWNNYSTIYGFYEEPKNTIETLFLGASIVVDGITPAELYRDYGICAYNMGTEQQPMMASYYWMLEADRLHKDSLKTIVLDTSMLRRTPEEAFFQKSLDGMKFSKIKLIAIRDYTENINNIFNYLFPVLEYHKRWESFNITDFEKKSYKIDNEVRGYNFTVGKLIDNRLAEEIAVPDYYIDETVEKEALDKESLYYLKKMIQYCNQNQLELILIKTPAVSAWNIGYHNAVVEIADRYKLEFIDFNFEPYIDEIHYNEATDSKDASHLNYYGAKKLTKWMGGYLRDECGNTDVRENEKYNFMEDELQKYEQKVDEVLELEESIDIVEYIEAGMRNEKNVILITVKDEASQSLKSEQKKKLKALGLKKLANIENRDSYIGVIDNSYIVYERLDNAPTQREEKDKEKMKDTWDDLDLPQIKEEKKKNTEVLEIEYAYQFDKITVDLKSGGYLSGNISSCKINGNEYSNNARGINIVIYNKEEKKVINSRTFDTCVNSVELSSDLESELVKELQLKTKFDDMSEKVQQLYLYNEMCEKKKRSNSLN